ncbi:DUF6415 family natural product biosynthesis protein [Streptomyces sp. NPDC048297]|uniref:DUF6415 family natural product biosynthesis protein n=1 Tax=Streptomyces sp. NPDC048297 TaxID=3365531 RepID=UPI00371344FF
MCATPRAPPSADRLRRCSPSPTRCPSSSSPTSRIPSCASACIGEARRKLSAGPSPRYGGDIGHARRLARVLRALCDHYESADDKP